MPKNTERQYRYTQNRELSWLRFNQRVLEEAADPTVPALERLKFVSIFSSNQDEFFMVRVGSLFDLARMTPDDQDNKTGWTAAEQLHKIYRAVPGLLAMKKQIYTAVAEELNRSGIADLLPENLTAEELKQMNRFFKSVLLPVLSPILLGPNHPVPHLVNKRLYAVALLEDKKGRRAVGLVPMPEGAPPYLILPGGVRYVRTENVLLRWLPALFDGYSVRESCVIAVTRNADISFDEEKFEDNEEDFRSQMKKLLKQRDHLAVVRLELSCQVSPEFQKILSELIRVETHQVFVDSCPLNMRYVFSLVGELPKELALRLTYPASRPRWAEDLLTDQPILSQIQRRDRLLFYPYDSVEPFLRLLNEAAENPQVLSIKITIYRLASSSKIAQTLCRAAENGKEVLVLMELRARFDEENNLAWSKMLEESGCQVIYGTEGFKCHSKICLITLRNHNKTSYLTQIGTGNYNEKTSRLYTDLSFLTASKEIGLEATEVFRALDQGETVDSVKNLLVAPHCLQNRLLNLMDGEIEAAARGEGGYIGIKINSLTDKVLINKLIEASQAGVHIDMVVRGICCLRAGVPDETDNIHIISIVGRYLEHSRIYIFGRGERARYYIGSADWMTRSTLRRVEIAAPITAPALKARLQHIFDTMLADNCNARVQQPDGSYVRRMPGADAVDCQAQFYEEAYQANVHSSLE
ncbi:MAG TPA: polyphosphate kinase 1 [Clostridiales bacterium]|nr:polyphosphate kinase 1 [Clostridiales bacterium]